MPQNRRFTPSPADALFQSACILGTFPSRQVPPEGSVEPVPMRATRESVVSQKADFSTFTMSNTSPKRIALIVKHMQSGDLLDCPLFATKPPFHPKSSRCSFSECLYTRHFPKQFPKGGNSKCGERGLWSRYPCRPQGKVNRFRRNSRHFPRRGKWRVQRERSIVPVPLSATGESEPFSRKFPALSPRKD